MSPTANDLNRPQYNVATMTVAAHIPAPDYYVRGKTQLEEDTKLTVILTE